LFTDPTHTLHLPHRIFGDILKCPPPLKKITSIIFRYFHHFHLISSESIPNPIEYARSYTARYTQDKAPFVLPIIKKPTESTDLFDKTYNTYNSPRSMRESVKIHVQRNLRLFFNNNNVGNFQKLLSIFKIFIFLPNEQYKMASLFINMNLFDHFFDSLFQPVIKGMGGCKDEGENGLEKDDLLICKNGQKIDQINNYQHNLDVDLALLTMDYINPIISPYQSHHNAQFVKIYNLEQFISAFELARMILNVLDKKSHMENSGEKNRKKILNNFNKLLLIENIEEKIKDTDNVKNEDESIQILQTAFDIESNSDIARVEIIDQFFGGRLTLLKEHFEKKYQFFSFFFTQNNNNNNNEKNIKNIQIVENVENVQPDIKIIFPLPKDTLHHLYWLIQLWSGLFKKEKNNNSNNSNNFINFDPTNFDDYSSNLALDVVLNIVISYLYEEQLIVEGYQSLASQHDLQPSI
jgi:hypothetical protein